MRLYPHFRKAEIHYIFPHCHHWPMWMWRRAMWHHFLNLSQGRSLAHLFCDWLHVNPVSSLMEFKEADMGFPGRNSASLCLASSDNALRTFEMAFLWSLCYAATLWHFYDMSCASVEASRHPTQPAPSQSMQCGGPLGETAFRLGAAMCNFLNSTSYE